MAEEHQAQDTQEQKLPTFSFTEAVRNLCLEELQGVEIESYAEDLVKRTTDIDVMEEYDTLQTYMDEYLEVLSPGDIENTLEQFCGILVEALHSESEEEFLGHAVDRAMYAEFSDDIDSLTPFEREPPADSNSPLDYDSHGEGLTVIEREPYFDSFTLADTEPLYMQSFESKSMHDHSSGQYDSGCKPRENQHGDSASSALQNIGATQIEGFGAKQDLEEFVGKRRLCRHFLKGRCNRGNSCDFLHDESIFCTDEQKVFLGGLPSHVTDKTLRLSLLMQGYTILNKPKVLQGFSPQICLGTVQEAQSMIRKGKILVQGALVDVRPYEAFAKDRLKMSTDDEVKRSVFIGGLLTCTTGWMIKERLKQMGFKTVNYPVVKSGFTPQVILASVQQARRLVKMKKIKINGCTAEIRPYSKYRM